MNERTGQSILVIGAARQGLALARHLASHGARVILNDRRPADKLAEEMLALRDAPVEWQTGGHSIDLLDGVDLVCISGGIPLDLPIVVEAARRGLPLSNDSQILMQEIPCPVVGITGSAGKTTTTTLVGRMAMAAAQPPRRAWVGGNIGQPLIAVVDQMTPDDLAVVEFSSFQLEQMTISPQVAGVLNITPNHLDRHGTLAAYTAAKARLIDFQTTHDVAVLNREDPGSWSLRPRLHGALVSFGFNRPGEGEIGTFLSDDEIQLQTGAGVVSVMPIATLGLRGDHNRMNALAACAIAHAAGLPVTAMRAGVDGFTGVAHRLEFVAQKRGASWYNDSIATAPERSAAAIRSFSEPLVLLLGGRDKNLPWEDLAELVRQRVDHVVAFGQAAGIVIQAIGPLQPGRRPFTLHQAGTLYDAIQAAAAVTSPGDVVLLSPGGTSFDEFNDFEQRGERFRLWVNELT